MNKNKDLFDSCIDCLTKKLSVLRKMVGLTQKDRGDWGGNRQAIITLRERYK